MSQNEYTLAELSDLTGIEPRTIRSYIERALLPGAEARGRAATYSSEHLSRLQVIQSLRRARPNIALSDIRILLQQMSPDQIYGLAHGSLTATAPNIEISHRSDTSHDAEDSDDVDQDIPIAADWQTNALTLTGAERLVQLLRDFSGLASIAQTSKVEGWNRIAVTPDIELSVRSGFNKDQLASFRELADLLRHLIQHPESLVKKGDE